MISTKLSAQNNSLIDFIKINYSSGQSFSVQCSSDKSEQVIKEIFSIPNMSKLKCNGGYKLIAILDSNLDVRVSEIFKVLSEKKECRIENYTLKIIENKLK